MNFKRFSLFSIASVAVVFIPLLAINKTSLEISSDIAYNKSTSKQLQQNNITKASTGRLNYKTFDLTEFNRYNGDIVGSYTSGKNRYDAKYDYNIQTEKIDMKSTMPQIEYDVGNYISSNNQKIISTNDLSKYENSLFASSQNKTLNNFAYVNEVNINNRIIGGSGDIPLSKYNNNKYYETVFSRDKLISNSKIDMVCKEGTTLNITMKPRIHHVSSNVFVDTKGKLVIPFVIDKNVISSLNPYNTITRFYKIGGSQITNPSQPNVMSLNNLSLLCDNSKITSQKFKIIFNEFWLKIDLNYNEVKFSLVNDQHLPILNDDIKYSVRNLNPLTEQENLTKQTNFNPNDWKMSVVFSDVSYETKPNQMVENLTNLQKIGGENAQGKQDPRLLYDETENSTTTTNPIYTTEIPIIHRLKAPFEIKFKPFINSKEEPKQALFVSENGSGFKPIPMDAINGMQVYYSYKSYMDAILNKQTGDITYEIQVRQSPNDVTTRKNTRELEDLYTDVIYYRKFILNVNSAQMSFLGYAWDEVPQEIKDKYLKETLEETTIGNTNNNINGNKKKTPNPYYRPFLDASTGLYKPQIAWVQTRNKSNNFQLDPYNNEGKKIPSNNDDAYDVGYLAQINAPAFYSCDSGEVDTKVGSVVQVTSVNYDSTEVITQPEYKIDPNQKYSLNSFVADLSAIGNNPFEIMQLINNVVDGTFLFELKNVPKGSSFTIKNVEINNIENSARLIWTVSQHYAKGKYINEPLEIKTKLVNFYNNVSLIDNKMNVRSVYCIKLLTNNGLPIFPFQTKYTMKNFYNFLMSYSVFNRNIYNFLKSNLIGFNVNLNLLNGYLMNVVTDYPHYTYIEINLIDPKSINPSSKPNNSLLKTYTFRIEKNIKLEGKPVMNDKLQNYNNMYFWTDSLNELISGVNRHTMQIQETNSLKEFTSNQSNNNSNNNESETNKDGNVNNNQVVSQPQSLLLKNNLIYEYDVNINAGKDIGQETPLTNTSTDSSNNNQCTQTINQYLKIDNSKNYEHWKNFIDINHKFPKDIFSWYNFAEFNSDPNAAYGGYVSISKDITNPLFVDFFSTYQARHLAYFLVKQNFISSGNEETIRDFSFDEILKFWQIYVTYASSNDINFPKLLDISKLSLDPIMLNYSNEKSLETMKNEIIETVTSNLNHLLKLNDVKNQLVYDKDFSIYDLDNLCLKLIKNYNTNSSLSPEIVKVQAKLSSNKIIGSSFVKIYNSPFTKNVVDLYKITPSSFTMNSSFPTFDTIFPECNNKQERIRKIILTRVKSVLDQYSKTNHKNYLTYNRDYRLTFYYLDENNEPQMFQSIEQACYYLEWSCLPPNKNPSDYFYNEIYCNIISIIPNNNALPKAIHDTYIKFINNSEFNGSIEKDPVMNPDKFPNDQNPDENNPGNELTNNKQNDIGSWITSHPWIFIVSIVAILLIAFSIWAIRVRIKSKKPY